MPRRIRNTTGLPKPVAELAAVVQQQQVPWEIPVTVVTPIFGGGHAAGEVDPVTPISAKAIRGQLRYWWRLTCSGDLENPTGLPTTELLALREAEVFGNTELPSPFDLVVAVDGEAKARKVTDPDGPFGFGRFGPEMYALFPATQDRQHQVQDILKEGLKFTLTVKWLDGTRLAKRVGKERKRFSEENQRRKDQNRRHREDQQLALLPDPWDNLRSLQAQLEVALWAWLNFGGVGARTRRGLGAVACTNEQFSLLDGHGRLRHPIPGMTIHYGPSWAAAHGSSAPMQAWAMAVGVYQAFRQKQRSSHPGRQKQILKSRVNPKTKKLDVSSDKRSVPQGRTKWPEPDGVRLLTGKHLVGKSGVKLSDGSTFSQNDHSAPANPQFNGSAFPRAMLGMPIIFHFADGPVKGSGSVGISDSERDPDDVTLVPRIHDAKGNEVNGQRLASPVITRPIFLTNAWKPAVIVIRTSALKSLHVAATGASVGKSREKVPDSQIQGNSLRTLAVMNGQADALYALEAYIQDGDPRFLPLVAKKE